jgi:Na+/H+-dicarboxylate symporter/ABC-type amino acid transport substrate-binding protein
MSDQDNSQVTAADAPSKTPLSMPKKIMIGLLLGILTGIFFGEITAPLKHIGNAFVGLLQMTVLPYIILALIGGIGKLSAKQSRLLLSRIALIIMGLWGVGLLAVLMFGLSLPSQVSASFFSTTSLAPPKEFDFFALFIPSNLFQSLAENKVPAIVVFCLLTGAAVIGMQNKRGLLNAIETLRDVMGRVTDFIVDLSPYGVFCIAAAAAGTMDLAQLGRIQGFLVILTVITAALCFLLIPALITTFTPFKRKDFSSLLGGVFVLSFATGKTLVVLPMLIAGVHKIFKDKGIEDEEATSTIDVLVPLAYSFPHLGRILSTTFIPFGAWYIGAPLLASQYPLLLSTSVVAHFSNSPASIPFLLDMMKLPSDLFQLFVVTSVYVGRITDGVGAAYILAVTIFGTCVISGHFKPKWTRFGIVSLATLAFSIATIVGGRAYLELTSSSEYSKDKIIASMQILESEVSYEIVKAGPNPVPLREGQSHLQRILEREVIRVGFRGDNLPFAYFNGEGLLAGFDIEMVDRLANEMNVSIEYVPIQKDADVSLELQNDFYDIAIGGFVDTLQSSFMYPASEPYMFLTMALVVPDYRDKDFADMEAISELDHIKIGVTGAGWFMEKLRVELPQAEIVLIDSPRDFFEGRSDDVDALLFSAEAGSAWSMLYPRFQVVTPLPRNIRMPLIVPYAGFNDTEMDEFLDNWVMLSRTDGTYDAAYDYWILGEGTETYEPRWSIIRDVLHWID